MQMRTRKLLSFALSFMVAVTFCFGGMGVAVAEAATGTSSWLATGEPVVLITGDGIIKDGKYSKDNVGLEKSYTLDELKEVTCGENITYSALNTHGTKSFYAATGVYVDSLLEKTGFKDGEQKLSVIAPDGYIATFDPNSQDTDNPKETKTTRFGAQRYYYPGNTEGGKEPRGTMIAWAWKSGESTAPVSAGEATGGYRLITGQLTSADQNNPLFNGSKKTANLKVQVGEALPGVITIGGEAKTRADILLMKWVEKDYTYDKNSGPTPTAIDHVKGVPLSVLLDDDDGYKDTDVVNFTAADGYPVDASGMTKAELVEKNYILAYEKNGEAIYNGERGFFTLYGEGDKGKPAKKIDSIKISLANAAVIASNQTYDGKAKTPAVTVTLNGETLKNGTDYTVAYSSNTNAGTANITVTGNGKYTGTATGTFKINKAKQAITGIKASMTKTYGNKAFLLGAKAEGTLSYESSDEKVAAVNKDGKVTIKGPGKATITIKAAATDNYEAAAAEKVTITVKPAKAKVSNLVSKKKGTLKVTWKKDGKATGYQVMIAKNKKFTQGKKTATIKKAKTTSKTFSKLTKGKKYYAKVRSYKTVNGKKIYGAWSAVKTKTVKKK